MILLALFVLPVDVIAGSGAGETIRVALLKDVPRVVVAGDALTVTDAEGSRVQIVQPAAISLEQGRVSVAGTMSRSLTISANGIVRINGKGYRGTIYVIPSSRGLLVVDELLLEEYLVGLINSEISSQWPIEAVKAQAVVARSYALFQKQSRRNQPFHLESTVNDQVYDGSDGEDNRAIRAVQETCGQVLEYEGRVAQSLFHANCGGQTENSEHVWATKIPYLRGVNCSYCAVSTATLWEQSIASSRLEGVLRNAGYRVAGLRDILVQGRFPSGRVRNIELVSDQGAVLLPAVTLRKLLGYTVLRSTNFTVRRLSDTFLFTGTGYGHGVGLCQWGAKARAEEGFDYREILAYYYPGTRLTTGCVD